MPPHRGGGQGAERLDRHKAKRNGKRRGGEWRRPQAWRRDTPGHLQEQWGIQKQLGFSAGPLTPGSALQFMLYSLSEHWQGLK